jgi:hypothetical protein
MEIVMPVYLRSQDAITAYGDGCGNIVIKQFSASDHELLGEVRLTIEQLQDVLNFQRTLEDEAREGSPDLDELEAE